MAWTLFRQHASLLSKLLADGTDGNEDFEVTLKGVLCDLDETEGTTALRAALCLLNDLARQRWSIRVTVAGVVEVKRPTGDQLDPLQEKARIRAQELIKRNEQLREPATRKFIKGMERKSVYGSQFVSIYSLIRDGRDLADSLRATRSLPESERVRALQKVITPYLQFVDNEGLCEHTGLRLQDIWRYFRHTWTNQYTNTPGRSLAFLVRDRAQKFNPIIGIGSIGSPIVQIRERDEWIGWHPDTFIEFVNESPSAELGVWLNKTVETAIGELSINDFIEEQLITPAEIRMPNAEVVSRLTLYSFNQRELHHRLALYQELKGSGKSKTSEDSFSHWQERSLSHLYRSKRALLLAEMLHSRIVLQKYLSTPPTVDTVRTLLRNAEGRQMVKKVLRKARADRVGIAMADITVCGAVAPYNVLLGGKLLSLLAVSPEVIAAYRDKYLEQESEIASSMAGHPIVRPSELVFLSTTSLYGIGSSQYNRIQMPLERIGGVSGEKLTFLELGKSEAYGTSHFSTDTVDALVTLVQQSTNGQRVNSIFGEGVSPKLRKIRQGLDLLNLPTDSLLQHGRQRIVYGVPVARNYREFLLGMDDKPEYIFDMTTPQIGTEEIARWWTERWLSKRIDSDNVLSKVQSHTLVQPVRHGARVILPPIESTQLSLFDDLSC
jgi:hypothetical protein